MAIGILYHEDLKEYDFGPGHPFRGDRYEIFPQYLKENLPEDDNYIILGSEPATDQDLLLICEEAYINFTREYYKAANLGSSYPGQFYRFHSGDNMPIGKPGKLEEAARLIVGQAKKACDLVLEGKFNKVISIGGGLHHAKPSYGEGFCLYNDVAFCASYLKQEYGLEKILILDTDAHAGNGTAQYFNEDPRVLFVDLHQDPMTVYPGTGFTSDIGAGRGKGYTVNIPMPVYSGYESYKLVFESIVEPVVQEFQPQIIVRNGGSDPHFDDGLTSLGLPVRGFEMIGEKVKKMSNICGGRVIDLIASGYNREVLPRAWMALICGLAGFHLQIDDPEPLPQRDTSNTAFAVMGEVIEEVKKNMKNHWECFQRNPL